MEKYNKVIDMTEHPEKYTDRELQELFKDPEIREIYNVLCDADSALRPEPELGDEDVEREWKRLSCQNRARKPILFFFGRRVAAVAAIAVTSVAALAIGVGLIVGHHARKKGIEAPAQISQEVSPVMAMVARNSTTTRTDTITVPIPVVYENETLGKILSDISDHYGLKLDMSNKQAANLRLFFRWNPAGGPEEAVRQLNNFEKIKLTLKDGVLTLK